MATDRLAGLGAGLLGERIADGALRSAELAASLVRRMAACGEAAEWFVWYDAAYVLRQGEALERHRGTGRALGPLHGLPVAVGDLVDTRGIPTALGTKLENGRIPERDAFVVDRLRAAGAVLVGKTIGAELGSSPALRAESDTDPKRARPLCGAAAAVAAGLVPLALQADTGGIMIRAAAEAGVVGYIPSRGTLSRRGCFAPSPSLAGIALLGRCVADVALLGDALHGHDDPEQAPAAPPRLRATALSAPPAQPSFAILRTPFWDEAGDDTQGAFEELALLLGDRALAAELPPPFGEAPGIAETIRLAELSKTLASYARRGGLSEGLSASVTAGEEILARDYLAALDWPAVLRAGLETLLARCDAIITPASPGIAGDREGEAAAGFNSLWSLCGMPSITLPVFEGRDGHPIGLQLVARRGDDARLLRNAHWIEQFLTHPPKEEST